MSHLPPPTRRSQRLGARTGAPRVPPCLPAPPRTCAGPSLERGPGSAAGAWTDIDAQPCRRRRRSLTPSSLRASRLILRRRRRRRLHRCRPPGRSEGPPCPGQTSGAQTLRRRRRRGSSSSSAAAGLCGLPYLGRRLIFPSVRRGHAAVDDVNVGVGASSRGSWVAHGRYLRPPPRPGLPSTRSSLPPCLHLRSRPTPTPHGPCTRRP